MSPSILVVDDEQPIRELLRGYLQGDGHAVLEAGDGPAAVAVFEAQQPDLIVLDLMLPGFDGLEVCRRVRSTSDAYVLMLTARGEEIDRIVGLEVGADDYLVKPFSPRELVARVKALLRRPRSGRPSAMPSGLQVDLGRRRVAVDGRDVALTYLEFELLAALARESGMVIPRQQLMERVWGAEYGKDDHLLDVHLAKLRRKLADNAAATRFIETVRGAGLRLREP
jgi:DNA-binding response OmpR family regulator